MTGDVKIELTITADAVEKFFSLLGLLKERTEETREKTTEEIPPITPKEDNKKENKEEKKESNISSCYVDGDDVIAIKSAIKPIANNSSNKVNNSSIDNTDVYPPTMDEIKEYAESKGYDLNAYRFFTYYSRLGWCDKFGNPVIPVWRETIDYWMNNDIAKKDAAMQPVDKSKRVELRATHPFTPTDF